jgi:tRNA-modifying protein YgfZ
MSYEALQQAAALLHLTDRSLIMAHGEDTARLLHAMSTNHVEEMQPGDARYAFFLSAQGRIQADAWLLCITPHQFLIDTEASAGEKLFAHLDKYIIADDVELENVTARYHVYAAEGPQALRSSATLQSTASYTGAVAFRAYTEAGPPPEWATLPVASLAEAERLRIENGHPRYGIEILETHLVQEVKVDAAVHSSKGCYLGQEIVERVRARGAVHKGLGRVRMQSEMEPAVGAEFLLGGQKAGTLLSVIRSGEEWAGIAMLRADLPGSGKAIELAGATATAI